MKIKKILMVGIVAAVSFISAQVEAGDIFGQVGKLLENAASQKASSYTSNSAAGFSVSSKDINAGKEVVADFMHAILKSSYQQGAQAVAPYIHKSLQSPPGKMSKDTYQFQYKKAHGNAKFYKDPVRVVRTQNIQTQGIGYASDGTFEKGRKIKFFLARKNSATGLPAALEVFFPDDGGSPSISYMGNL